MCHQWRGELGSEESERMTTILSRTVCGALGGAMSLVRRKFPPVVRIETTNACNARCIICPHRDMRRPIVCMDETLYRRLIDECSAAGCREVHLHNFGEPLLDKHLDERIRYAKSKGIRKVKIFCNGSLLTADRAKGLIDAGLDEIKISFDGATREEFERIRPPLKFDAVVENISRLVELRNSTGSRMKIHVACCSTTDKQGTMRTLEKIVDGFAFGKIHNWGDGEQTGRGRRHKPCSRLWRTFTVLANGDVSLCCLDYDGQHLLGRIDERTTIASVWNSPAYDRVRKCHRDARQNEIALCKDCSKASW
jgi:radical SAM protein with 4Fe4S-binding SPASM domain